MRARIAPFKTALADATLLGLMRASPRAAGEQNQIRAFGQVSRLPPLTQPLDPIMRGNVRKAPRDGRLRHNLQLVTGHALRQILSRWPRRWHSRSGSTHACWSSRSCATAEIVGSDYEVNRH
jgi:hypothetical protein